VPKRVEQAVGEAGGAAGATIEPRGARVAVGPVGGVRSPRRRARGRRCPRSRRAGRRCFSRDPTIERLPSSTAATRPRRSPVRSRRAAMQRARAASSTARWGVALGPWQRPGVQAQPRRAEGARVDRRHLRFGAYGGLLGARALGAGHTRRDAFEKLIAGDLVLAHEAQGHGVGQRVHGLGGEVRAAPGLEEGASSRPRGGGRGRRETRPSRPASRGAGGPRGCAARGGTSPRRG
jgi:hypothetical protein